MDEEFIKGRAKEQLEPLKKVVYEWIDKNPNVELAHIIAFFGACIADIAVQSQVPLPAIQNIFLIMSDSIKQVFKNGEL